jgi:dipeptidyl aminopeptidase/acylaminoacyl peptidase
MNLLDHHLISERYFFPRPDQAADACEVACDGAVLRCFERSPHPGAPTLVYFHGNGEVVADYVPEFADLLLALGVNVFLAEYRGYGGSSG